MFELLDEYFEMVMNLSIWREKESDVYDSKRTS